MIQIIPAVIGIQVRRTIAKGLTPAAPATAMMTPVTGLIAKQNALAINVAVVPPSAIDKSFAMAAKAANAPTPDPVKNVTAPTTPVITVVIPSKPNPAF